MSSIDYLGIEARGFIFGPAIALAIGAKFIPLRKPKKLPGMDWLSNNFNPFLCLIGLLYSLSWWITNINSLLINE